jgi:hypothetical protein
VVHCAHLVNRSPELAVSEHGHVSAVPQDILAGWPQMCMRCLHLVDHDLGDVKLQRHEALCTCVKRRYRWCEKQMRNILHMMLQTKGQAACMLGRGRCMEVRQGGEDGCSWHVQGLACTCPGKPNKHTLSMKPVLL